MCNPVDEIKKAVNKVKETIERPADAIARSDLGKINRDVTDSIARSDIGKVNRDVTNSIARSDLGKLNRDVTEDLARSDLGKANRDVTEGAARSDFGKLNKDVTEELREDGLKKVASVGALAYGGWLGYESLGSWWGGLGTTEKALYGSVGLNLAKGDVKAAASELGLGDLVDYWPESGPSNDGPSSFFPDTSDPMGGDVIVKAPGIPKDMIIGAAAVIAIAIYLARNKK